jgi:chemotaxis protein CheD
MTISWKTGLPSDAEHTVRRLVINQGDYHVSDDPRVIISTILGSCVAACLRDPRLGVGGMNHFVLPRPMGQKASAGDLSRYGCFLMEQLIDALLKRGASLNRIEAKIYGGASSMTFRSTVGERNIDFATRFLTERGITISEAYVGGTHGCKLEYWPVTGKTAISLVNCLSEDGRSQAIPDSKTRR